MKKLTKATFKLRAAGVLFVLGVLIVVKNLFFADAPNAYELLFAAGFIKGALQIAGGKFHGIDDLVKK